MKHIDEVSEQERTRIAREIHDEMGHLLTSLKFDIEGLAGTPDLTREMLKEELASLSCVVDDLIRSVRKIATDLRPGILDHLGLIPALEWQLEQFCSRTGIYCDYDLSIKDESFNDKETTVIFRIFQEILTNIARHARANKISVSLFKEGHQIMIVISDNGIGFNRKKTRPSESLGLLGMRERALSVGGELTVESEPGKGTRIIFSLPRN
jgi:signal transduction histidine kinase